MEPNTARHVLRISPEAALTSELIEASFARESWARHPSLYSDPDDRIAAEAWAATLGSARTELLRLVAPAAPTWQPPGQTISPAGQPPGATAPETWQPPGATSTHATMSSLQVHTSAPPRADEANAQPARRLSRGAIVGFVAGGVALLLVIVGAVWGISAAAPRIVESIQAEVEELETAASDAAVDRYYSGETLFTFPAALEVYGDGRYSGRCSSDFAQGCWQMALFTEQSCTSMEVVLAFSDDEASPTPQLTTPTYESDVEGNAATVVVFGNDDYTFGWITDVICHDEAVS
ncbi:hypothetical protein [Agromyces badenianii]|uniref:hypothetical protein n=1 Tax=Agromyces badenianii TaxID=2080742 RepID=UPI000D5956C9|nr:hypothetical protein [Agromyces badenianii]PWC02968.1 hypothetical protein DCE94_14440 [Agromyces badenianii]